MNQLRTKRTRTAVTALFLAALPVALSSPVFAAQPLGTLISEGGFDWMAGTWITTTDQGETIEVTYKWAVEKHVIAVHYKSSSGFDYHGLIFYRVTEDKIVHIGADNLGGVWEGTWDSDGRRAIMEFANTRANGEIRRGTAANSRVDADTMKVEMYLAQDIEPGDEPMATMTYKRKKPAQKANK